VLAREQVARLIEAAPGPALKYKTARSVAYGAGLRGGEVVMLRVGDIASKRMLIRVELGKGRKSLPSRKRGIGTPCCRRSFSRCSAHGGCNAGREAGCFRVRTRCGQ
jgi:site-specific recombinase XerC